MADSGSPVHDLIAAAQVTLADIEKRGLGAQREGVPTGSFWFEPEHPEEQGLCDAPIPEGERKPMVGPVYVDLDREGINRLIRTLRKARDQAYGADA